jgi:O-antigen ligase
MLSHPVIPRGLIAIFTALVFLLIQSVFWSTAISTLMAVVVVGLIVVAYFRPQNALLVLAALAPLGGVWSPLVSNRMRGAEVLVLAFLAGALLRGWTLHRFRDIALGRLQIATFLFGLIVSLSCVHQLWLRGVEPRDLLEYVTQDYVTSFRGYGSIFQAMLLIEGLALLLFAAHYCRAQPEFMRRLVRMLVVGGVAAASVNFWFFVHELIETGDPTAHFMEFFRGTRWSAHVSDVNAAGSFFLMIMSISLGLSLNHGRFRLWWLVGGLATALALWMTASRTALVAAAIVGSIVLAKTIINRFASVRQSGAIIGILAMVFGLGAPYLLSRHLGASASSAVKIRWEFLGTTWRMLEANPLFGVGIGQYPRWSGHFSSPELLVDYPRENAHNNFAQVAGELGLVGIGAFVTMLAICLWPAIRSHHAPSAVRPVLVGVTAFMISWLGGHPLLVPEVAYPFWLALGVVASVRLT